MYTEQAYCLQLKKKMERSSDTDTATVFQQQMTELKTNVYKSLEKETVSI